MPVARTQRSTPDAEAWHEWQAENEHSSDAPSFWLGGALLQRRVVFRNETEFYERRDGAPARAVKEPGWRSTWARSRESSSPIGIGAVASA
jgi:hypothetical protein